MGMILLIDNYDSFTYNLYHYVLQLGMPCTVVRNNQYTLTQLQEVNFTAAIISPGPKTPAEAGITNAFIEKFYNQKPILGICLGHQALGQFFGAQLARATQPVHGKTSVIEHTGHPVFNQVPRQTEVMRYHSLLLTGVANTPLQVIAQTAAGETMAIAHPQYPLVGLQFHPESILTTYGLSIMRNWLQWIG